MTAQTNSEGTNAQRSHVANQYEVLTVYKGRNSITYLLSDWEKHGEDAEPLYVRQHPLENAPFVKFNLADADTVGFYKNPDAKPEGNDMGKWDLDALKRLSNPQKGGKANE